MHPALRRYPRLHAARRVDARYGIPHAARPVLPDRRRGAHRARGHRRQVRGRREVIGIFIPALAGENHAGQAIDAGLALLRATGHETDTPWARIGIGINTGVAFVGVVGTADHIEFTALGDNVNVTARLASAAAGGELLVTDAVVRAAGLATTEASGRPERRRLDLRGKTESTDVIVLTLAG